MKDSEVNPTPMRTTNNRIVMRSTSSVSGTTKPDLCRGKKSRVLDWLEL